MRERLGAAAALAPHAAGSGPGRRLVGPRPPAVFACAERAPLAAASWARAAPWEPPRPALQVRVQALGGATRAWAPRQARGHCSTATAAANAPPWALPPAPRAI